MSESRPTRVQVKGEAAKGTRQETLQQVVTPGVTLQEQFPSTETVTETQPAHEVKRSESSKTLASIVKSTTTAQPSSAVVKTMRPAQSSTRTETRKSHLTIKVKMSIPIHNKEPKG